MSRRTLLLSLGLHVIMCTVASQMRAQPLPKDSALEVASFDSAWRRIRDSYYDAGMRGLDWNAVRAELRRVVAEVGDRAAARAAIRQMLELLGESHFALLPGELIGTGRSDPPVNDGDLGIELRLLDGVAVVARVEDGSPAMYAGVRPGWIVISIEGSDLPDFAGAGIVASERERRLARMQATLQLQQRLGGPAGTPVRIQFLDDRDVRRDFTLVRRAASGRLVRLGGLPPQRVRFEWRRETTPLGCIGLVRFDVWAPAIAPRFDEAMSELRDCRGVILDLRGNVGGVAAMVMGFAGYFFEHEVALGSLRMRGGELRYVANPRRVDRNARPLAPFSGQVALLVDELSASTSEIFAAALQSTERARVFGVPTSGQALPSLATRLPNGDLLVYAIADFVAPGNRRLEGCGVAPDEVVLLDREGLLRGGDTVLDRARGWIWQAATFGATQRP